jgi:ferredoxin
MKAVVDLSKCQGYANCVIEADSVFDIDDETGKATVLVDQVPPDLVEDARRAAASCPVGAIEIQD